MSNKVTRTNERRGSELARRYGWPMSPALPEMSELIDRLFGFDVEPFGRLGFSEMEFVPQIEVHENENNIEVTAELPGIEEKDVELTISEGSLVITGEKKEEIEKKEKGYHRTERRYGSFRRMIPLGCEVKEDKAEATYINGILKVLLPKAEKEQKKTKKIEIKK